MNMPMHFFPKIEVQPRKSARILLWGIALIILILFAWAALANVNEVVRAQGKVIPSRQLQVVSNLEGGIVKGILVRQGNVVKAGQPLIQLDATALSAEFGRDRSKFDALVAKIFRLQAELDGRAPIFSPALSQSAPDLVAVEQSLYEARRSNLSAAVLTAEAKLQQARQMLGQAQVEATTKGQAQAFAEQQAEILGPLVEMGSEPRITLLRAQQDAKKAAGEYSSALLAIERARSAVAEASSEVESVKQQFRTKSFEELTAAKAELAGTGQELPALQDRVRRAEVRAPVAGVVNRVLVSTIGGVVKPGEPLVEIVPQDGSLVIEARVRPSDIASIHIGQKTLIKLSAYDFSIYGGLNGVIEHISSDAVPDETDPRFSYYIIRVRANDPRQGAKDRLSISPGMMAEVNILGEKRSILSYLLTPITRLKDNAFTEK